MDNKVRFSIYGSSAAVIVRQQAGGQAAAPPLPMQIPEIWFYWQPENNAGIMKPGGRVAYHC